MTRGRPGPVRGLDLRVPVTTEECGEIVAGSAAAGLPFATWARGVLRAAAREVLGLGEVPPDAAELTRRAIDAALAVKPRRSDAAIAERLGVTVSRVRRRRVEVDAGERHPIDELGRKGDAATLDAMRDATRDALGVPPERVVQTVGGPRRK